MWHLPKDRASARQQQQQRPTQAGLQQRLDGRGCVADGANCPGRYSQAAGPGRPSELRGWARMAVQEHKSREPAGLLHQGT